MSLDEVIAGRRKGWEAAGLVVEGPAPSTDPEGERCHVVRLGSPGASVAKVLVYDWGGAVVSFTGAPAWEPSAEGDEELGAVLDRVARRVRALAAQSGDGRDAIVAEARAAWDAGDALEAGMLLYESLPARDRPGWAGTIVAWCCELVKDAPAPALELAAVAAEAHRWPEACELFDALRALTLRGESPLLRVAENAAKVICNAAGGRFDHNAGWKLVAALHEFAGGDEDAWRTAAG